MPKTALNRVDPFPRFFEAANNLRNIIWVTMTQSELSITVVFSNSINEALNANEESKVETTTDS